MNARLAPLLLVLLAETAWAAPDPAAGRLPKQVWPEMNLRLDIGNWEGPKREGHLSDRQLSKKIEEINDVWLQCGIRFVPRRIVIAQSHRMGLPYEPASQSDALKIWTALHPLKGMDGGIPLAISGPWKFFDPDYGLFLKGLGWFFARGDGSLERIGAMVSNDKIHDTTAGALMAHELGHVLSLGHSPAKDNLMGGAQPPGLTPSQCVQSRTVAKSYFRDYQEPLL